MAAAAWSRPTVTCTSVGPIPISSPATPWTSVTESSARLSETSSRGGWDRSSGYAAGGDDMARYKPNRRNFARLLMDQPAHKAARSRARLAKRILEEHRSEEHTSELQSRENLVCRLLLEKKK